MENIIINVPIMEFNDNFAEQIFEQIESKIPEQIKKKISSPAMRKQLLAKYGEEAFLLPSQLKFPIVNPETGDYDCRLLYAAYLRANQYKDTVPEYKNIAAKAKELYTKTGCYNTIGVQLEGEEVIDLESFLYLMS